MAAHTHAALLHICRAFLWSPLEFSEKRRCFHIGVLLLAQYRLLSTAFPSVGGEGGRGGQLPTLFLRSVISSGDTGRAHSGNFVFETLCSENNFISDIYEDLCYVFVFGYYLKRTISNMHTNEKKAGFHNLSQGRKGPSQEVV